MNVEQGMEFKLCLLIYKALNEIAPPYISELITYNNIGSRGTSSPHVPLFMKSPTELFKLSSKSLE
jgi:3-deoxy-D-arabino-heptulosonate 7-phosphate (DAHP) synthase